MTSAEPGQDAAAGRRAQWLLALGAAAGLALAAGGLLGAPPPGGALPDGIVARVGAAQIRSEELERLVAGLEQDTREAADAETRNRVLERMIDEELLVQRAVELGLVDVDRRVRANLTSAMISSIVADAEDREASGAELRGFYAENADFFTSPGRLRVHQIFFRVHGERGETAEARASEAYARLQAGEPLEVVRTELGDREISPLPDAMLPALKLREYVGPTALRTAMELEVGTVSQPVRSGTGFHVLALVDREPPSTPPFEEIESQVRSEWRRRLGDSALRAYLDGLRDEIDVVKASAFTP